jgi:hypothetical protein
MIFLCRTAGCDSERIGGGRPVDSGSRALRQLGVGSDRPSHSRASINLFFVKPLVVEPLIGSVLVKGKQRIVHLL